MIDTVPPAPNAHVEVRREAQGLAVRAFVPADRQRPLKWSLKVMSHTSGGRSQITQGGVSDGSHQPVASVMLSSISSGEITLSIFDGDAEIARETFSFDGKSDNPAH
ncbi:MAG: curli-like amyloid fiber formation chaperone CsgH [Asticcacaulis sp.]